MKWPWRKKSVPDRHPLPGWPAAASHPDSLSDDLRRHLYESLYAVTPGERLGARWVMSGEWWRECRKMVGADGRVLWEPSWKHASSDVLLGLPVEVRDGGGTPHLEPTP